MDGQRRRRLHLAGTEQRDGSAVPDSSAPQQSEEDRKHGTGHDYLQKVASEKPHTPFLIFVYSTSSAIWWKREKDSFCAVSKHPAARGLKSALGESGRKAEYRHPDGIAARADVKLR